MRPTIVLDFETYWNTKDKYSLKFLPNFDYVTDPRFKAHGVAVLYPESGEKFWVTHNDLEAFFADENWDGHTVLMQNAYFDGLIMQHHFDVLPQAFIDTRGMANVIVRPFTNSSSLANVTKWLGLRGKIEGALESTDGIWDLPADMEDSLAEYAVRDVEETYGVFERLAEYFPVCEYPVMDVHIKLYLRRLMRIDMAMLHRVREMDQTERVELARQAAKTWPHHFEGKNPDAILEMFRKQSFLADLIVEEGLLPPRKRSPTTGKITYAFSKTDVGFQRLAEKGERARLLVACRTKASSSLIPNRLDKLELMHNRMRGFAHPYLNYYGAHTGRSSGGDSTNFQSMPKKPEEFRQIFVPAPGHKVLVCDSAQIEARVLAYIAGHEELLNVFREADELSRQGKDPKALGKDVYSVMAERVSADSRDFGKAVVLGCGFGMSLPKFITFAAQVGLTDTAAVSRAWNGWRAANEPIVTFWHEYEQAFTTAALLRRHVSFKGLELEPFREDGLRVWLPSGRYIAYGGLRRQYGSLVCARSTLWYGSLVENLVQAYARDVVFYQLLRRQELLPWVWLLVHDEVNLVVPESLAEQYRIALEDTFRKPLSWCPDLPVFGDAVVLDRLRKV